MKPVGLISTGILLLLLAAGASTYAFTALQGQHHGQQGGKRKIPPPWQDDEEDYRPSRQEEHGREDQHRGVWREHRAQNWESEHRNWQDRGGYDGYRIPENRYRGRFGPNHPFRIHRYPVRIVGGFVNFQFGGFGFSVVDPLPEYWSDTWYDHDDVYIDYSEDGYYLHNRRHPQDRIAISVNVR